MRPQLQADLLLSTVGTSLLRGGPEPDSAPAAQIQRHYLSQLKGLDWTDPRMGAELNSLSLLQGRQVSPRAQVHFFYSDSPQGALVAGLLQKLVGDKRTHLHRVEGLNPMKPELFARKGLPRLAAALGRVLRGQPPERCAIDATGGFKAQVGVVVALGQALQIPVYYRHETFSQIIALPPMPIALDADLWCQNAGLFFELAEGDREMESLPEDPRLQGLLDWEEIDSRMLVGLNATGMIFHEALLQRWPQQASLLLPEEATRKEVCPIPDHNWPDRERLQRTMQKMVDQVPYITRCHTHYLNPDLPRPNTFLLKGDKLLAQCSNGTHTLQFEIHTTARHPAQLRACLTDLLQRNAAQPGDWL